MIKVNSKVETEVLLNELYPFAERMLNKYQEFHPFGGYVNSSGKIVHVSNEDSNDDESGSEELQRLISGLKIIVAKEGARVCGFAVNVVLPEGKDGNGDIDAVRIFLEHRDGYCADVFYCYSFISNKIFINKNYAQRGNPIFFK